MKRRKKVKITQPPATLNDIIGLVGHVDRRFDQILVATMLVGIIIAILGVFVLL